MEKVNFTDPDTNESAEFYVLEQTTIRGINYLLVTVDEEGDSDAFILKKHRMKMITIPSMKWWKMIKS